jgi:heptosyltransferase-2
VSRLLPAGDELTDLVWVQTGFIGDVVLTTGAFELAQAAWPGVRQWVVTTRIGAQALAGARTLAGVIVFERSGKGARGSLAALRSTAGAVRERLPAGARAVTLLAHRSFRSGLLARAIGLPSVGYEEADAAMLLTRRVPRVAVLHEAQRIALLLEPLGVERAAIVAAMPALAVAAAASKPEVAAAVAHALGAPPRRLVAIAPGSVWGTKKWTVEGFAGVARALLAGEAGADGRETALVFIGAPAEKPTTEQILALLPPELRASRVADLVGLTTLDDLRWLLPQCALLIANDSSPIHFASALGVPTVCVFGATIPEMGFAPLAPRSRSVGLALDCRPCSDHGPQTCPLGHFKCMRELSVERVLGEVRAALDLKRG